MLVPNRHASSAGYRYGFQGQEKDDEIKGEGNSLNYKYRMHDPRVGRFFAVDPLTHKYSYYTPYSFSGNRLIDAVELEGLEEYVKRTNRDYGARFYKIQLNDNLTAISRTTNVALTDIIKWNKIEKPNTIQPGYTLFLFDGSKLSTDDFKMSKGVSNFERVVNFVGDLGKGKYAIQKQALWVFQAYTLGRINPSSLFPKQALKVSLTNTAISGGVQVTLNEGEVNVFGAFSDGFLKYGFGDIAGSAFEFNINFKDGKISSENIFNGTKTLENFGAETIISLGFGAKQKHFLKS